MGLYSRNPFRALLKTSMYDISENNLSQDDKTDVVISDCKHVPGLYMGRRWKSQSKIKQTALFLSETKGVCMRSKYKLVFLGDQNVGKTTLISQFVYKQIDKHYEPTIGIDFLTKKVDVDDREVKLQLWDTAGQEKFHSIISSYARDSFLAVILFDVGNESTFLKIDKWITDLVRVHDAEKKIKVLIVGNKIDLVDAEVLSIVNKKAAVKARYHDGIYVPASAVKYEGIKLFIDTITELLREDLENRAESPYNSDAVKSVSIKKRCC